MERTPFSDEERRQQADQSVFEALNQLQGGAAGATPPASPQDGAAHWGVPAVATQQRPINPLLVLLDFFIAFLLTVLVQIPLVVFFLGTREDFRELLRQGDPQGIEQALRSPSFFMAATLLQALAFLLVVVVRTILLNRRGWHWLGLGPGSFSSSAVGWGVLGGLGFLAINVVFTLIAQGLGLAQPDQANMFPLANAAPAGILAIGLGVVVLAPLSEELFFRAYAQRVFVERYGPIFGIFIGSVLFTLPHLLTITQGFIVLLGAVFAGGLILGWVYWRTGSLTASIVAHAINNAAAFSAILFNSQLEGLQ